MAERRRLLSDFLSYCYDERQALFRKLDLRMDGKDWKSVAGKLGFKWQDVLLIDQKEREPSAHVLHEHAVGHPKTTLSELCDILSDLGREDAVDILQPLLLHDDDAHSDSRASAADVIATPTWEERNNFLASPPSYEETSFASTPFFPGREEEADQDSMIHDLIAEFGVLNLHDLDKPVVGKVALLIGNENYDDGRLQLKTPHTDVRELKAALEELGFKVMSLVDLTRTEMQKTILSFTTFLSRCMYAVFFFGGHGFEGLNPTSGDVETFLVPVDAPFCCSADHCVKLQEDVLDTIQECDTAMNLIIVDTCRTWRPNPQASIGGSQRTKSRRSVNLRSKGNTVFAFSTCSAQQAYETHSEVLSDAPQNSVYVSYLKEHLKLDIPVEQVLKKTAIALVSGHNFVQIPTVVTNLIRDCKLTDPVDDTSTGQQVARWANITDLPSYQPFRLKGFSLTPKFVQKFSNVLIMVIIVENENTFAVRDFEIQAKQPGHGVHVQQESPRRSYMAGTNDPSGERKCVAQIAIGCLQRLEDGVSELSLPLTMSYHDDRETVPPGITLAPQEITFEVDLGTPLFATASANWDAFISGSYEQFL